MQDGEPTRRVSRIQDINIYSDVDPGVSNAGLDLLHDAINAKTVQVPSGNDLEAAADIVADVTLWTEDGGADPNMDRGVVN